MSTAVEPTGTQTVTYTAWALSVMGALAGSAITVLLQLWAESIKARRDRRTLVWKLRIEQLLKLEADAGRLTELTLSHNVSAHIAELRNLVTDPRKRTGEFGKYGDIQRHLRDLVQYDSLALDPDNLADTPEEYEKWRDMVGYWYSSLLKSIQAELDK